MTDPNPETAEPVDIDRLYGDHPPETPASLPTPPQQRIMLRAPAVPRSPATE